jgi:hypothetical protein
LTKQIYLKHSQNNLPKTKEKINCELGIQRYYLGNITKLRILDFASSSISYSSDICDHNQQESRLDVEQCWVYLPSLVYSHGQLYVVISRVTSSANIKIFSGQGPNGYMRNVVYKEVLEM